MSARRIRRVNFKVFSDLGPRSENTIRSFRNGSGGVEKYMFFFFCGCLPPPCSPIFSVLVLVLHLFNDTSSVLFLFLLTKHFIELRAASPEGSAHVLDIPGLKKPSIKFWSFWENGKLMGCGALKFLDQAHGEFKSIRIHDDYRGKGNGIKIITHLIEEAKKLEAQARCVDCES